MNQPASHPVNYLTSLNPLRGIAAILVAVFHFEMAVGRFIPASISMFLEKCYIMVDLFFIMSGFIMMHVYKDSFSDSFKKASFKKFIVARFARIYPLHFFSLTLLILGVILLSPAGYYPNKIEFPGAILTNYLLLNAFYIHPVYTWNIPSWSIGAEWAAYLLFPFIVLFIQKIKKPAIIFLLVFIAFSYYAIMFLLHRVNPLYPNIPVPHNLNTTYDYGFLRGITGFTIGILLYLLYQSAKAQKVFQKDAIALITMAGLFIVMHFGLNDSIIIILFSLLVISFASNNGMILKICRNKFLQYLGDISYSIYLMQTFLQEPFSKGWRLPNVIGIGRGKLNIDFTSGFLYCILYLALLIFISSITYYFIEKPCRKYINSRWG